MNGDLIQIVGWSLIHFLWQGAVIALLLQGGLVACRTAAARYRWLMAALMLMLAAPIATARTGTIRGVRGAVLSMGLAVCVRPWASRRIGGGRPGQFCEGCDA